MKIDKKKTIILIIVFSLLVIGAFMAWFVINLTSKKPIKTKAITDPPEKKTVSKENKKNNKLEEYESKVKKFKNKKKSLKTETLQPIEKLNEKEAINPFSFVAIGDSESYSESTGYNKELPEILSISKSYNPDFALFTGDIITATGKTPQEILSKIQNVKNTIENYYDQYFLVLDKHDIECGPPCVNYWHQTFWPESHDPKKPKRLFFSFNYENTHFTLLSTSFPIKYSLDQEQLKWLEEDLKKNQKPNIIVSMHVPPVTFFEESAKKCHDLSCEKDIQQRLLSIFEKYKVDLVISGHEHAFDHQVINNVHYILSGDTGNGPRYKDQLKDDIFSLIEVNSSQITIKAITADGKIKRTINIAK